MGTIWVKEFIGGLDTRKLSETTPGGVLIRATNGHITRGGEFEKRAAFVSAYTLLAGTVGLANTPTGLVVFGSGVSPVMPAGVTYQRLRHPDGATALVKVPSFDLYAGKVYAAGVFADGSIHHFYDGVRVGNWYDGRARATFTIVSGVAAAFAAGSLRVTAGVAGSLDDLKVGGVSIIDNPVPAGVSEAATATAIAAEISTGAAGYSAAAAGDVVTITAPVAGAAPNGAVLVPTATGGMTIGSLVAFAGGVDVGRLTSILVGGVQALGTPVAWAGTAAATATAVANQINATVSDPEYIAAAAGAAVSILAVVGGTAANGRAVVFATASTFGVTPPTGLVLSQGVNAQNQTDAVAATSTFTVTASTPGAEASCTVGVNSSASPETVTDFLVNGIPLIPGVQSYPGSDSASDIAASLAAVIAAFSATSGFTASAIGPDITVTGIAQGSAPNGFVPGIGATGGLIFTPTAFSGGADGGRLYGLTIGGVSVTGGMVEGNTDAAAMATAIAASITAFVSAPDYTAVAAAGAITITATDTGTAANGRALVFGKGAGLVLNPVAPATMNNGVDAADGTFQPGDFVKTIGAKMYSTSGPNTHFSGIKEPTQWTTDATGAGFVDMSSEASGSEQLTALAKYRSLVAVFAERTIQTWYFDPDPTLNKQSQVLNNTGTASPRSVTQFGDNDLFYCDESGVRSLRARDASNSAATSDIGVAIDSLILADLEGLTFDERDDIIGVIEQRDGRFWLAIHGTIYVFSFFGDGKVSAWSTYETGFPVEQMIPFRRKVYIRSGNTIYVYGGLGATLTYDDTEAEAWLPYLDGNVPAQLKHWTGFDAAVRGVWEVRVGQSPTDTAASDKVATIWRSSYNDQTISLTGASSHISLRFTSKGTTPATIGAALIHYEGDADED